MGARTGHATFSTQWSGFALDAEKIAGSEHAQAIYRLAEKVAEVAAVECEQHVGAGESTEN